MSSFSRENSLSIRIHAIRHRSSFSTFWHVERPLSAIGLTADRYPEEFWHSFGELLNRKEDELVRRATERKDRPSRENSLCESSSSCCATNQSVRFLSLFSPNLSLFVLIDTSMCDQQEKKWSIESFFSFLSGPLENESIRNTWMDRIDGRIKTTRDISHRSWSQSQWKRRMDLQRAKDVSMVFAFSSSRCSWRLSASVLQRFSFCEKSGQKVFLRSTHDFRVLTSGIFFSVLMTKKKSIFICWRFRLFSFRNIFLLLILPKFAPSRCWPVGTMKNVGLHSDRDWDSFLICFDQKSSSICTNHFSVSRQEKKWRANKLIQSSTATSQWKRNGTQTDHGGFSHWAFHYFFSKNNSIVSIGPSQIFRSRWCFDRWTNERHNGILASRHGDLFPHVSRGFFRHSAFVDR